MEPEESETNQGNVQTAIVTLNVIEFIEEELREAEMTFSEELFDRVFRLLYSLRSDFEKYYQRKLEELENETNKLYREGIDKIRRSDFSVSQIKREEEKLNQSIEIFKNQYLREITQEYPSKILGSHEDDAIRDLALELIVEKHQLSNIYLKEGSTELEIDRLNTLVLRAIDEWKSELVNQKIQDLFKQFHEISGKGEKEEEHRIQLQLNSLMALRTKMAKCIGERILFNGVRKK